MDDNQNENNDEIQKIDVTDENINLNDNNEIQKIDVTDESINLNETKRINVIDETVDDNTKSDYDDTKIVDVPNQSDVSANKTNIEELFKEKKPESKKNLIVFVIVLVIVAVLGIIAAVLLFNSSFNNMNKGETTAVTTNTTPVQAVETKAVAKSEYYIENNNFSKFDMSFLKFENDRVNKIYSPLSIKYAFKMLFDGTTGEAHDQLASIVEGYNLTQYKTSENLSLANAFFVRETYKPSIKEAYSSLLQRSYNADFIVDSFASGSTINDWVSSKTLGLINNIVDDDEIQTIDFALVNALGIDMEWKNKFTVDNYKEWEEQLQNDSNLTSHVNYENEKFYWHFEPEYLAKFNFENGDEVSGLNVLASINNYDIISELGVDNIKAKVFQGFKNWAYEIKNDIDNDKHAYGDILFNGDFSEENINNTFERWFTGDLGWVYHDYRTNEFDEIAGSDYIKAISSNYGKLEYNTDFRVYDNNEVKVFAKDLKRYNGTTLEYVGIMPKEQDLNVFIDNSSYDKILKLANSAKELKNENFDDGYITFIHGLIPKFDFEYELDLMGGLKKLGVTDIFERGKAGLTEITDDENAVISKVKHKANIEFSQYGIKAAAATMVGGDGGGGDMFYYPLDVPVKEIDITFDRPYLFIIRDKDTGEVWFVGTVYDPLKVEDDKTIDKITYEASWRVNDTYSIDLDD